MTRRRFNALTGLGAVLWLTASVLTLVYSAVAVGCAWTGPSLVRPLCAAGMWPWPWYPTLAAALLAVLIGSGLLLAMAEALRAVLRTRRLHRSISELAKPPSPRMQRIVEQGGCSTPVRVLEIPPPTAFSQGLLRPTIVISEGAMELLDDAELAAVLAHEQEHCRGRDPLRLLLARALSSALCALPLARWLRERAEVGLEVAADVRAARDAGQRPLRSALEKMLDYPADFNALLYTAGFDLERLRIEHLVGRPTYSPPRRRVVAVSLVTVTLFAAAAVALITAIAQGGVADIPAAVIPVDAPVNPAVP